MKPISMILIAVGVTAVGVVVFVLLRNSGVQAGMRETGKDIQRGARDAYNGTKDAAVDATDAVHDAVK